MIPYFNHLLCFLGKLLSFNKSQGNASIWHSYFWNLPFASVRQCKYVMDKADIPEDEWTSKRAALAAEHNLPGAREQLAEGFKNGCKLMFKQRSTKAVPDSACAEKHAGSGRGWLDAVSCHAAIAVGP